MTEIPLHSHPPLAPKDKILKDEDLRKILVLTKQLLLDGNQLRPNTFLCDAAGTIRTTRDNDRGWPRLNHLFALNQTSTHPLSPKDILTDFCTGFHLQDRSSIFGEKSRFVRKLLRVAMETPLGSTGMMIDPTEARQLIGTIPKRHPWRTQEGSEPIVEADNASPRPIMEAVLARIASGPSTRYTPPLKTLTYEEKMRQIEEKKQVALTGGEFLRFLLVDRDGKRVDESKLVDQLSEKVQCTRNHLFHVFHQRQLPKSFQFKLTAMTKTRPYFWSRETYSPDDANSLKIEWETDISALNQRFAQSRQMPEAVATTPGR